MDIGLLKSGAHQDQVMFLLQMADIPGAKPHSSSSDLSTLDFSANPKGVPTAPPHTFLHIPSSPSLYFPQGNLGDNNPPENGHGNRNGFESSCTRVNNKQERSSMEAMREMIFRIAAMQPVQIDPESVKPRRRKNVRISKDPQSVAARHRRERISERIRILQRLVPGGTKMDTASMLDEAIHYVSFLKTQVQSLQSSTVNRPPPPPSPSPPPPPSPTEVSGGESCFPVMKGYPHEMHTITGGWEHYINFPSYS